MSKGWVRTQKSELRGVYEEETEEESVDEDAMSDGGTSRSMQVDDHSGHSRAAESAMNNSAFLSKTKFSQEKYLRKKHEKFAREITVLKPCLNDFCEINSTQIRGDILGSLMRFSGVRQGSVAAVVDDGAGILTAALVQRLCSLDRLVMGRSSGQEKAQHVFGVEKSDLVTIVRDITKVSRFYDSIMMVHNGTSECDVDSVFETLEPRLKLGGTIALYSRTIEPLLNILYELRGNPEEGQQTRFINVQLTEQMCREQEVLKDRTHPIMQQSLFLFQGFVLSAIKVMA